MRITIATVFIIVATVVGHASEALTTHDAVAVTVRVHDYVRVDQKALTGAERLVDSFYAAIGVRTDWIPTRPGGASPVARRRGDRLEDLIVIVLNRQMSRNPSRDW